MPKIRLGRNRSPGLRIEYCQTNGVLLRQKQHSQTGSQANSILMLAHTIGSFSVIPHRTTLIEKQRRSEIGLIFILPDEQPICLPEELPVNGSQFVPFDVLAMLFEFDARTAERRTVASTGDSLDDSARKHLQSLDRITILFPQDTHDLPTPKLVERSLDEIVRQ